MGVQPMVVIQEVRLEAGEVTAVLETLYDSMCVLAATISGQ
jgi:hypothetical protein